MVLFQLQRLFKTLTLVISPFNFKLWILQSVAKRAGFEKSEEFFELRKDFEEPTTYSSWEREKVLICRPMLSMWQKRKGFLIQLIRLLH